MFAAMVVLVWNEATEQDESSSWSLHVNSFCENRLIVFHWTSIHEMKMIHKLAQGDWPIKGPLSCGQ